MKYVAGFVAPHIQPQTYPASPEAREVDRQSVQAIAKMKLGSPGSSQPWDELNTVANSHGMLATQNGLATYERAMKFLLALPPAVKPPELSVDPDGEIAFDWDAGDNMLSISLNASGGISYAAHIDGRRLSGPAFFGGGGLPQEIVDVIAQFG